jgi:succinate dehydrogenase / fumarate reductase cytochrome b subunit
MSYDHTRPLSPHLQIYKWQISSVLSILHRITGFALAVGTLLLVAWLWTAAYDFDAYDRLTGFIRKPLGLILLAGWTFAFYYHLANGIRHLCWDAGWGYEIGTMTRSGWAVVLFSFAVTAGTWWFLYTRVIAA